MGFWVVVGGGGDGGMCFDRNNSTGIFWDKMIHVLIFCRLVIEG